jgi:hypothetical protein
VDVTPSDLPAARPAAADPLERLEELDSIPLAEQVAVFDEIHTHLSARLRSAES